MIRLLLPFLPQGPLRRRIEEKIQMRRTERRLAKIRTIDRDAIDREIDSLPPFPLLEPSGRKVPLIVSMTSFPPRMPDIYYAVYSILTQSVKPDRLLLYLKKEEFPNLEADLPESLLQFKKHGLEIRWCDRNFRSYAKLLPALKEFPDAVIVTTDDDIFYGPEWLQCLYQAYLREPAYIHAHRARRVPKEKNGAHRLSYYDWTFAEPKHGASFRNLPTGAGGVLYPPGALDPEVFDEALFLRLAPLADDIWFWAMAVRHGTAIKVPTGNTRKLCYINPARELGISSDDPTLWRENGRANRNDPQFAAVLEAFPEIAARLDSAPGNSHAERQA